jgi:hypothetical protein
MAVSILIFLCVTGVAFLAVFFVRLWTEVPPQLSRRVVEKIDKKPVPSAGENSGPPSRDMDPLSTVIADPSSYESTRADVWDRRSQQTQKPLRSDLPVGQFDAVH